MATKIAVMNKGVIQQVGSPDEIYDQPENVFVADFVGSPSMNMVDGVIPHANGAVADGQRAAGLTFDLSDYRWRQPAADGQTVKVGFRPEHFAQPGEAPPGKHDAIRPAGAVRRESRDPRRSPSSALPEQTIAVRVDPHAADRYRREATAVWSSCL